MMRTLLTICLLMTVGSPVPVAGVLPPLEALSLKRLEELRTEVEEELDQLAAYSLRSGTGSIGYRSRHYTTPEHREWIQIDFHRPTSVDQVVLVPTISRDSRTGFKTDGFPDGFKIFAGSASDPTERLLATFEPNDPILPRLAPLVIPADGAVADWIRIETTHLSRRAIYGDYVLQFSEILVFSGDVNAALHAAVEATSNIGTLGGAWDKRFLVDGHTPYLMDSAKGVQSMAYISDAGRSPVLQIDLEREQALHRIHLHTVDPGDTVPQAFGNMLGFPPHLTIEGACREDFADAISLLDIRRSDEIEMGPVMMWNIPPTTCRYVRILNPGDMPPHARIGFAEIELFSTGPNIALHKPVTAYGAETKSRRSVTTLTDGLNFFGSILPMRQWMNELARRHELETQRPRLDAEIERRYQFQRRNFHLVSWLAALLAVGIGFTILISHILQMRQAVRLKTRFAADLHDELGANLHAIGLLGDLARDAVDSPQLLTTTLEKLRALTERSGEGARHCAELQEAGIFGKLPDDMRRTANRLMTDVEYQIDVDDEDALESLSPQTRADLFLFYKECLVNISRHSGAKKVDVHLARVGNEVTLVISDNGHGLPGEVPPSLRRRARLLGGRLTTSDLESGGTCISMVVRLKRFTIGTRI